jgi:tetratricopeptide (TPR) repeat protein
MLVSAWALLMFALLPQVHAVAPQTAARSFATLSQQAQAARDAHQLEKAVTLYKQALKLKPNWEDGLWSLGSIAYDLDRYSDCASAFQKLSKLKPDGAPGWTMSGLCEYKLHNYGSALDSLTHVEQLAFNENAELARAARLHYALVLSKTESFEKAITILTDLTRVDKKTPEVIVAAGIAGLRRPWLPPEVPESERELVYRVGDAMTSAMELDYTAANQKFEELLQAYPSEPNVHFRYGALLHIEAPTAASRRFRKRLNWLPIMCRRW